jgi:hypothetical protein
MILVEQKEKIIAALECTVNTVVLSALALLQTLALCKHEIICEALVGSG